MSDDATRNLLGDRIDQLISLVKNLTEKHTETDARVERLERVLEERLYDTRPIWEALRSQVQELDGRVGAIESEMTGMRAEMTGMRAEMTGMRAEMTGMRAEMTGMRAQFTEMLTQMIEMLRHITEMRVETGNGFRSVDRKIGVLGKTLIDMTADIRELQDKVEKIESQPS
jgi:chromosome segregation ATPase